VSQDVPEIAVRLSNDGRTLIVPRCPFCGRPHDYGSGDPRGPAWPVVGPREAVCGDGRRSYATTLHPDDVARAEEVRATLAADDEERAGQVARWRANRRLSAENLTNGKYIGPTRSLAMQSGTM
jgi:hypothetical protein